MTREYIWVIPGDPSRVGAAERHPDHPGGEIWVAGDAADLNAEPVPVKVAMTPFVNRRLGRQEIKQVPAPRVRRGRGKAKVTKSAKEIESPAVSAGKEV